MTAVALVLFFPPQGKSRLCHITELLKSARIYFLHPKRTARVGGRKIELPEGVWIEVGGTREGEGNYSIEMYDWESTGTTRSRVSWAANLHGEITSLKKKNSVCQPFFFCSFFLAQLKLTVFPEVYLMFTLYFTTQFKKKKLKQ